MKTQFKIGDRVKVTFHEDLKKLDNGTVVAIDEDGDYLVKLDNEQDYLFNYCMFNKYKSDKFDLVNIQFSLGQEMELL